MARQPEPAPDEFKPYTITRQKMAIAIKTFILAPDGPFPNNPCLPLRLYPQAIALAGSDPAAADPVHRRSGGLTSLWQV